MYTGQSPIVGPSTPIDIDRLIAWAVQNGAHRTEELESYFTTLKQGSDALGIDFVVMVAQWWIETGHRDTGAPGHSPWWRDGLNPAGLGITGDPAQNAKAQTWKTGKEAAQAHLAHMSAYVYGDNLSRWPATWPDPEDLDIRFDFVPRTGPKKPARTLEDLNQTWAIDAQNNYHGKLATRANRIVEIAGKPDVTIPPGEEPMETITFGNVPMYGYTDRQFMMANKPEGVGWNNLGRRVPKGIVLHRMLGSLLGTDGYFADPTVQALTDYGVGVEAMDGKSRAGHIYQWNDPFGFRAGWASGPVSAPYGDGKRFVDKYGISAVNRDLISLEISGKADMPIDDVAWGEIVHFCAWWFDFLNVPYHSKTVPATGINALYWHEEFTVGTGKTCPFEVVKALTNRLYNDVAAFNKPHQLRAGGTPQPQPEPEPIPKPEYAAPIPIPALAEFSDFEADSMSAVVTDEGEEYVFVNDIVRAIRATPRLQRANAGAERIGPHVKKDEQFEVRWLFKANDGRAYYVSPYWSRFLVSDTERVSDAA